MKTKRKNKEKFYKVTGILLALLLLASVLMLVFMPKVEEQNYFPSFVRFNDVIKQDTNLHWPCPIFDTVEQLGVNQVIKKDTTPPDSLFISNESYCYIVKQYPDTATVYGIYFYENGIMGWELVNQISYNWSYGYFDMKWDSIDMPFMSVDTNDIQIQRRKQWK